MIDYGSDGEAWSRLGLYLSRDVIQRRYEERHGETLDSDKAAEIISHLDQGRQYFRSAESAGVLAGALEQYYGALALARAIVLFRTPTLREATLDRHHGLTANLPEEGGPEDIQVKVASGTFDQLLEATGNAELCSVIEHVPGRRSRGNRTIRSLARPPRKSPFRFDELLARIPHLRAHFEEAFQRRACCYGGRATLVLRGVTVIVWRGQFDLPDPLQLREALGMSAIWSARATPSRAVEFSRQLAEGEAFYAELPNIVEHPNLAYSIAEPFLGGWHLSEICAYYAASYVMSMLVRYHPSRWTRLLGHQQGDRLMPVLERMRALVQTQFVRLVLWEFERPCENWPPSTEASAELPLPPLSRQD